MSRVDYRVLRVYPPEDRWRFPAAGWTWTKGKTQIQAAVADLAKMAKMGVVGRPRRTNGADDGWRRYQVVFHRSGCYAQADVDVRKGG